MACCPRRYNARSCVDARPMAPSDSINHGSHCIQQGVSVPLAKTRQKRLSGRRLLRRTQPHWVWEAEPWSESAQQAPDLSGTLPGPNAPPPKKAPQLAAAWPFPRRPAVSRHWRAHSQERLGQASNLKSLCVFAQPLWQHPTLEGRRP